MIKNQELLSIYLRTLFNAKASTIKQYEDILNIFDRYINKSFLDVQEVEILDFLDTIKSKSGKEAKPTTKNKYITTLKNFYTYLLNSGRISINPTGSLKYYRVIVADKGEEQILTMDEINNFVRFFRKNIKKATNEREKTILRRDLALYSLMIHKGFRIEEMLTLEFNQLNYEEKIIKITAEKSKTSESKTIGLSDELWDVLEDYLNSRYLFDKNNSQLIFLSRNGNKLATVDSNRNLKKYAEYAEIKKNRIYNHLLRHTSVTTHLATHSLTDTMKMAGHRSPSTTMRYFHENAETIQNNRRNDKLDQILRKV